MGGLKTANASENVVEDHEGGPVISEGLRTGDSRVEQSLVDGDKMDWQMHMEEGEASKERMMEVQENFESNSSDRDHGEQMDEVQVGIGRSGDATGTDEQEAFEQGSNQLQETRTFQPADEYKGKKFYEIEGQTYDDLDDANADNFTATTEAKPTLKREIADDDTEVDDFGLDDLFPGITLPKTSHDSDDSELIEDGERAASGLRQAKKLKRSEQTRFGSDSSSDLTGNEPDGSDDSDDMLSKRTRFRQNLIEHQRGEGRYDGPGDDDAENGEETASMMHGNASNATEVAGPPTFATTAPSTSDLEDAKFNVAITRSAITQRIGLMKFLRKNCQVQNDIYDSTDILCVGQVTTTFKLLFAVVKGIAIVSDEWITKSSKAGKMLEPDDFLIRDKDFRKQYGRFLADTAGRPSDKVFSQHLIYVTPALKKVYREGFADIRGICIAAGAKDVVSRPAREVLKDGGEIVVVGVERGDLDAITLHDHGHLVRTQAFLPDCIFRGQARWDGTHVFTPGVSRTGKKNTKGRKGI